MTCFIILHYMAMNETINCISSIKSKITEEKKIVIIDNKSPNGTGELLRQKYFKDKEIEILFAKKNLGFARGNNIGYVYVKKKWNPQFIIFLNNDVEVVQDDLVKKIHFIYEKEKFYILGPDIYSDTYGLHQSPKRLSHFTENQVYDLLNKLEKEQQNYFLFRIRCFLKSIFYFRKIMYRFRNKKLKIDYSKKYYNIPIHGSFLVFSQLFIQGEEYAFYPETFFYYETEILDYLCDRKKMKVLYEPSIKVIHHQNVATDMAFTKMVEKTKFSYDCTKQSLLAFLKLIKRD